MFYVEQIFVPFFWRPNFFSFQCAAALRA